MTANKENKNSSKVKEEEIKEGSFEETAEKTEDAEDAKSVKDAEDAKDEKNEKPKKEAKGKESEEKVETEDNDAKYLRVMADFQNYKKRVEKEKKDLYAYANENIMNELLAVMDNFERALEQDAGDGFKEGMEMIFKQLDNVLTKSGLAEIPALGEDFDPNVHNAVMTEEAGEYESGKVSGVMQKGYTLNGKVIRPSMVKVTN